MSTKIGLVSDVHATPAPLAEALAIFQAQAVDMVLCPGDIAGYADELEATIQLLIDNECQAIQGNHEVWRLKAAEDGEESAALDYFRSLPQMLDLEIEGKRLHVAHAHPPQAYTGGIKLLDQDANLIPEELSYWREQLAKYDYDVLVVGHTHQVFAEQLGRMLVINPGSSKFNHTCAILRLPEMTVEWFALSNQQPVKTWNWGNQVNT